ncbi:MAG: hypothetical protein LR008_02510 [Candidatus Pacebacteria bacterium]|nr:hypothetical protein [Candidatus Paceibacterota bacterium]
MKNTELFLIWRSNYPPPENEPLRFSKSITFICQKTSRKIKGYIVWSKTLNSYVFIFIEQLAGPDLNLIDSNIVLEPEDYEAIILGLGQNFGIYHVRRILNSRNLEAGHEVKVLPFV